MIGAPASLEAAGAIAGVIGADRAVSRFRLGAMFRPGQVDAEGGALVLQVRRRHYHAVPAPAVTRAALHQYR